MARKGKERRAGGLEEEQEKVLEEEEEGVLERVAIERFGSVFPCLFWSTVSCLSIALHCVF